MNDEGDFRLLGEPLEEAPEDRRFTRADLPGEEDEAPLGPYAEKKVRQGLPVLFAGVEIAGIDDKGARLT